MTSKLKCPFCGKKLWYDEQDGIYRCMKSACVMDYEGGTEQLWRTLTQAKQDLEIARKALEDIASGQIIEHSVFGHECDNKIAIARNALEQIEHKENQ